MTVSDHRRPTRRRFRRMLTLPVVLGVMALLLGLIWVRSWYHHDKVSFPLPFGGQVSVGAHRSWFVFDSAPVNHGSFLTIPPIDRWGEFGSASEFRMVWIPILFVIGMVMFAMVTTTIWRRCRRTWKPAPLLWGKGDSMGRRS